VSAEVFAKRGADALAMAQHHPDELADARLPLLEAGLAVRVERGALRPEGGVEFCDGRLVSRRGRGERLRRAFQNRHAAISEYVLGHCLSQFSKRPEPRD